MKEMKELPYTRQKRILERLNKNDCMTINELAKDFNVSQMTIYRDILQLEKSGDALRVYGGVKAVDKKEQGGEEEALKTSSILRPYCDVTIEERFNKQIDDCLLYTSRGKGRYLPLSCGRRPSWRSWE